MTSLRFHLLSRSAVRPGCRPTRTQTLFSLKMEFPFIDRHLPLVKPLTDRIDANAEGAFYVEKDACITCSLPNETVPACIAYARWKIYPDSGRCPDHCAVIKQPTTNEELELMIEAVAGSCISAIRYCGSDPYTLRRLREEQSAHCCDALPEAQTSLP